MNLQQLIGYTRSALIYAAPWRQPGLRRFYRQFIAPDDIVFDIGAHFGDRSLAFAALGARVIAVEPQQFPRQVLQRRLAGHPQGHVMDIALGAEPGRAQLALSDRHPTLATLSRQWREDLAAKQPGFSGVRWDQTVEVEVSTLDMLIEQFGEPRFCKIDVEGFEAEVLAGLSRPIKSLSFEYLAGTLTETERCIEQLESMAGYEYNVTIGERRRLELPQWQSAPAVRDWLSENADHAGSGDVYARRVAATKRR